MDLEDETVEEIIEAVAAETIADDPAVAEAAELSINREILECLHRIEEKLSSTALTPSIPPVIAKAEAEAIVMQAEGNKSIQEATAEKISAEAQTIEATISETVEKTAELLEEPVAAVENVLTPGRSGDRARERWI